MRLLTEGKKNLIQFWSRFDTYLTAALKFGIAWFSLSYLCSFMENTGEFAQLPVILILSAACSFLSANVLLLLLAVYLELLFYSCSLEAAAAGGIILLLFLLLYFSFLPRQAYLVILTVLGIAWKIPLPVVLVSALLQGPGAAAGIGAGTFLYYVIQWLCKNTQPSLGLSEELIQQILKSLRDAAVQKELFLALVVLLSVFCVVSVIRRLPFRYCWSAAAAAGVLVYLLLNGMGSILLQTEFSLVPLLINLAVGGLVAVNVQFFCFRLDYRRTQFLQFEDDEYYYYVKAIPKAETPETDDDFYLD